MTQCIKVSVILPVYNVAPYLNECLDSLCGQTLEEIEIICVDDGSTDRSLEILREYEKKESRIRLLQQKNMGAGVARNRALSVARGEYISFLDPDDFYPDERVLEDLYTAAMEQKVNIVGGSLEKYTESDQQPLHPGGTKDCFSQDGLISFVDYQYDYFFQRFLFGRHFLQEKQILFPPYKRYQDPPFLLKAMICAQDFYGLKRVSYRYRDGYKKVSWDCQRMIHAYLGMWDNLLTCQEQGFTELYRATLFRISHTIPASVFLLNQWREEKMREEQLFSLLHKINQSIDPAMGETNRTLVIHPILWQLQQGLGCPVTCLSPLEPHTLSPQQRFLSVVVEVLAKLLPTQKKTAQ